MFEILLKKKFNKTESEETGEHDVSVLPSLFKKKIL